MNNQLVPSTTVITCFLVPRPGWKQLERRISNDRMTSVKWLADAWVPTEDGREPWEFELDEAPSFSTHKSTDHTLPVGGHSPKELKDLLGVAMKPILRGESEIDSGYWCCGSGAARARRRAARQAGS